MKHSRDEVGVAIQCSPYLLRPVVHSHEVFRFSYQNASILVCRDFLSVVLGIDTRDKHSGKESSRRTIFLYC